MNYEEEVRKSYPDAEELDNETDDYYANRYWITDGKGNDISSDCKWPADAWKSAYETINKQ